MQYSTNFNFNLPEGTDSFNVTHQNENMETIDEVLVNTIFWVEYGVSTYAEILAEHNNGKLCAIKHNDFTYVLQNVDSVSEILSFCAIDYDTSGNGSCKISKIQLEGESWITDETQVSLGRATSVTASDTNYTTFMARGESLNSSETNASVNGQIAWMYE